MKAVLSVAPGGPETLLISDIAPPEPKPGEVRITVKAAAMNYPDLLIIEDKYQFRPERPFAPGAELSGVVDKVGPGVKDYLPGDRVMALPLWGALVQQICIEASMCRRLPDAVSFEKAAALQMAYGTAYYGLTERGGMKAGDRVLVLGAAGGVGLAAVELANAFGATVTAGVSTAEKGEAAKARGAKNYVICPRGAIDREKQRAVSEDLRQALEGGQSDIVVDTVGGDLAGPALRTLAWLGRFLVIGFPSGIPSIPANLPLLKSCDIRGVFWGAAVKRDVEAHQRAMDTLLDMYATGRIDPKIHAAYPMEDAVRAFAEMKDGKPIGKVVVTI
jgi:NADPH2:quinone reductase